MILKKAYPLIDKNFFKIKKLKRGTHVAKTPHRKKTKVALVCDRCINYPPKRWVVYDIK